VDRNDKPLDPRALAMIRTIFEEACRFLAPNQRTAQMRLHLASRILRRAAQGGITPAQLRAYALVEAASPTIERAKAS